MGAEVDFVKVGYDDLTKAQDDYINQSLELTEEQAIINDSIDQQKQKINELAESHENAYWAAYASIDGQIGLFETMSADADRSINDLIGSLDSQIAYMDKYSENITRAMKKGVDEGLVEKLSDGSEESAKILDAIVQGGEEDIKLLNEKFGLVEEGKGKFSGTVADMQTDFGKSMTAINVSLNNLILDMNKSDEAGRAARQTGDSYATGLRNKRGAVYNASAALARAANQGWHDYYQQHSPARVAIAAAEQTADSYAIGFERRQKKMEETTKKFARAANAGYTETMQDITIKAAPIIYNLSGAQTSPTNTKPVQKHGDVIVNVYGDGMIVRSDADIKKISQSLAAEAQRKIASKGGIPA